MKWTAAEATEFCRLLAPSLQIRGFAIAMAGSVLTKGFSPKDLDVVIFPYSTTACDWERVRDACREIGMTPLHSVEVVRRRWRRLGSRDEKHVEIWTTADGRRVDCFFLK